MPPVPVPLVHVAQDRPDLDLEQRVGVAARDDPQPVQDVVPPRGRQQMHDVGVYQAQIVHGPRRHGVLRGREHVSL